MEAAIYFSEKSKEELIEIILEKERRIKELEEKLKEKKALDEHKQFLKLERLAKIKARPRTPGQKAGHIGITRQKPLKIDRVVEQTLKQCRIFLGLADLCGLMK